MKLKTDPWRHIVLEDFLLPEHFTRLREIAKAIQKDSLNLKNDQKKDKILLSTIYDKDGNQITEYYLKYDRDRDRSIQDLNKFFDVSDLDFYNTYYDEVVSIMTFLDMDSSRYEKIERIHFDVQTVVPDYVHKVHSDRSVKLISIVIYLDPEDNVGTLLHETEDSVGIENPWVLNGGTAFIPSGKNSLHSFRSNGLTYRTTFNINLYIKNKNYD
jgi:hypothetical protein